MTLFEQQLNCSDMLYDFDNRVFSLRNHESSLKIYDSLTNVDVCICRTVLCSVLPSKLRSLIQFVKILYEGAFFHSYFCKISMELSYIDCTKSEKIMYWKLRCVWKCSIRNNFNPLWSVGYFEVKENGKKNNKKETKWRPIVYL